MHPHNRVLNIKASFFLVLWALFAVAAPAGAGAAERPDFFKRFSSVRMPENPAYFPALSYTDAQGDVRRLEIGAGEYVLLNVWATWCPPCLIELPSLDRLGRLLPPEQSGLTVLPVSVDIRYGREELRDFLEQRGLGLRPLNIDHHGTVMRDAPIRGLPTSFLLGPKRQILYIFEGAAEWHAPDALAFFRSLKKDAP